MSGGAGWRVLLSLMRPGGSCSSAYTEAELPETFIGMYTFWVQKLG